MERYKQGQPLRYTAHSLDIASSGQLTWLATWVAFDLSHIGISEPEGDGSGIVGQDEAETSASRSPVADPTRVRLAGCFR